jgi:hypothetical protein
LVYLLIRWRKKGVAGIKWVSPILFFFWHTVSIKFFSKKNNTILIICYSSLNWKRSYHIQKFFPYFLNNFDIWNHQIYFGIQITEERVCSIHHFW